jgi:hypothetical protein
MPVQGGNAIDHGFAYAGMVADNQVENAISKLNKSGAVIPVGYGVVTDGDDGAALPTDAATAVEFVGIVKREMNRVTLENSTQFDNIDRDMTVVTHGVVWATALAAVTKDQPVYLVVGDGTLPNANLGRFTNVAGTGATTAIEIAGAKWVSSAAAGKLAKISFGLGG